MCLFLSKKLNIGSQDKLKGICDISELLGVEMVTRDGVSLRGIKKGDNQTKKDSLDSERVKACKGDNIKEEGGKGRIFCSKFKLFFFLSKASLSDAQKCHLGELH